MNNSIEQEILLLLDNNYNKLKEKLSTHLSNDEIIPQVITIESDTYGTYNLELIIPIVYINDKMKLSSDLRNKLNVSSYSYEHFLTFESLFFRGNKDIPVENLKQLDINCGAAICGIYIPTKRINKEWSSDKKDHNGKKYWKKGQLPIIEYTDKQLLKFLKKNQKTIDEILDFDLSKI
jgi:hypothetical protein